MLNFLHNRRTNYCIPHSSPFLSFPSSHPLFVVASYLVTLTSVSFIAPSFGPSSSFFHHHHHRHQTASTSASTTTLTRQRRRRYQSHS